MAQACRKSLTFDLRFVSLWNAKSVSVILVPCFITETDQSEKYNSKSSELSFFTRSHCL